MSLCGVTLTPQLQRRKDRAERGTSPPSGRAQHARGEFPHGRASGPWMVTASMLYTLATEMVTVCQRSSRSKNSSTKRGNCATVTRNVIDPPALASRLPTVSIISTPRTGTPQPLTGPCSCRRPTCVFWKKRGLTTCANVTRSSFGDAIRSQRWRLRVWTFLCLA